MKLSHSTAVISESGCGPAMVRRLELKKQDFALENYSSIRNLIGVGNGISSEEFVCGGHRWKVMFAPEGSDADAHKKGFASIVIVRTTQATRNERFTFDIELLDQSGAQKNLTLCEYSFYGEVSLLEPHDCVVGPSEFILRAELDSPDSPYVKNDSLKIRAVVGAFTYHAAPSSFCSKVKEWGDGIAFIHVADRTFSIPFSALLYQCPKLLSFDRDNQLQDIVLPEADPCVFRVTYSSPLLL